MQISKTHHAEKGNALWFVLIAVALLAALTMAMTRSADTVEQSGDIERARLLASDLMRYTGGIKAAIDRMLIAGVSEGDICFHTSEWGNNDYNGASCANPANQIFNVAGAGLTWRTFDFVTGWRIFGSHKVENLETTATELIIEAQVSGALCREVNIMLGVPNPSDEAPEDAADNIAPFTGSYALAAPDNTIGDNAADLAGKTAACRKEGANYYFYQVLIKR